MRTAEDAQSLSIQDMGANARAFTSSVRGLMADEQLTMKATIKFAMGWLVRAARRRSWGEVRIIVQDGRITGVHEHTSYRARLPEVDESAGAN